MKVIWLTWMTIRAGNDGRRASGTVWQTTKYKHAVRGDAKQLIKTLCNREIKGPESIGRSWDKGKPKCPCCLKRSEDPKYVS